MADDTDKPAPLSIPELLFTAERRHRYAALGYRDALTKLIGDSRECIEIQGYKKWRPETGSDAHDEAARDLAEAEAQHRQAALDYAAVHNAIVRGTNEFGGDFRMAIGDAVCARIEGAEQP